MSKIKKICLKCNKEFEVYLYRKKSAKYCSKNCAKSGKIPWNKGNGKANGYKQLIINEKRIKEHIYNWMKFNNFWRIPEGFCVHHLDGNRLNNSIENLILLPHNYHSELHWKFEKQNQINRFGRKNVA